MDILKREFHDVIMNIIKRKRQLIREAIMSNILYTRITNEEEEALSDIVDPVGVCAAWHVYTCQVEPVPLRA